jgi:hypothetical protein
LQYVAFSGACCLIEILKNPAFAGFFSKNTINMPTISMFYGIIIQMYYLDNKQHNQPHIHANYGEFDIVISIPDGEILEGEIPNKKLKLILAWIEIHKEDLMADWKLASNGDMPHKIIPLR